MFVITYQYYFNEETILICDRIGNLTIIRDSHASMV